MLLNQINPNQIKVVGICGSLRKKSYTRLALDIALKGAEEVGANTELIDLRKYNLVFCQEFDDHELPEDVFKLRKTIRSSQGVILGTPEYHASFSGVIKNALDLMGFNEFESKMIGLIGVAGGSLGAINALNALRTVGRQLRAWVVPQQASIPNVSEAFDENEKLIDQNLEKRLKNVGRQVARFSFLHNSDKTMEFVKQWEQAHNNPGGV